MDKLTIQELSPYFSHDVKFLLDPTKSQSNFRGRSFSLIEMSSLGHLILRLAGDNLPRYKNDNKVHIDKLGHFKLMLRPSSDMTKEEMKELYFLVFKKKFIGDNITHRDVGTKEERYVLWSGVERLFIYSDGDVGADSDLHHYKVNHLSVIMWKFSKHFDLFNLIPRGLAIDLN